MPALPVYGLCGIVTASVIVLLALSTDFLAEYIHGILAPCQHDSLWSNGKCNCDNTKGIFSGEYCEECNCQHLGICSILENSSSRYGCRCPSHQKWTGLLCDKCYAEDRTPTECRGACVSVDGVYSHHGPKCNTLCMPHASSASARCLEVSAGGGECNACNGHGSCTSTGQCDCDDGFFTTRSGEQCSLQCSDAGILCPEGQGKCASIGGQLQCLCESGWYGSNCDKSCVAPVGNGLPCSGHGTCGYNAASVLTCDCNTHWIGEFCEHKCPGDESFPSECSGHGECSLLNDKAACECSSSWEGADCSCSESFTCSGHGRCLADATCECFDYSTSSEEVHFAGGACESCIDHWYGDMCHLFCDPAQEYTPDPDTLGLHIGCNGHGACSLETSPHSEYVACVCDGTDPDTFCASCVPDYFPLLSIPNVSVPHCSVACEVGTCSGHGRCNDEFDGTNFICDCDTLQIGSTGIILDTLDPEQNCATCLPNWYPSTMSSSERCSKYCASSGKLEENKRIYFETSETTRDYGLMGDTSAKNVCVPTVSGNQTFYEPDADCSVCSGEGTCSADGRCKCSEGTTGQFCNIQCIGPNGLKCSDHGRCVRNDLELWFNPYTDNYRCECTPYDTYTSETRQRLIKRGFQVEPPPAPDYYGRFCEFHCPRYNEEICANRGSCSTGVAVDDYGFQRGCHEDDDCQDIEGAFCARLTTPWDSLMQDGMSFFSSGPQSPGHYTCAESSECIDSIHSIEWDQFCVNMLNGWYPPILNTVECAYAQEGQCREAVETFFMSPYDGDKTWCESALDVLMAPTSVDAVCGKHSFADEAQFRNEKVPVCWEYTMETTCNAQSDCIFDQTLEHIQHTDDKCDEASTPCPNFCQVTDNQTCTTKTYCRAKTCADVMYENSLESLCITEPPCENNSPYGDDWADFCGISAGNLRNQSEMTSMELFYNCHMFRNRKNPQLVEPTTPGNIDINGIIRVFDQDVAVAELRASFLDSIVNAGPECSQYDFTTSDYCANHLHHVVPEWYTPYEHKENWFLPWIVVCPNGMDSIWATEAEASVRVKQVSLECKSFYRSSGVDGEWDESTDEKDTISFTNKKIWTLECPDEPVAEFDRVDFQLWPERTLGCSLTPHVLLQRWGQTAWSAADIEEEFHKSCVDGLKAPWIPRPEPLPTLCDLGACHPDDSCLMCDDASSSCDATASVQCTSAFPSNYREENRCAKGGHAWQPLSVQSTTYYCDWHDTVAVHVHSNTSDAYSGELSVRGILTITNASESFVIPAVITVSNESKVVRAYRNMGENVTIAWSDAILVGDSEVSFYNLKQCNENFNWYSYCANQTVGEYLNIQAPFGLSSHWSGDAKRLSAEVLTIDSVQFSSPTVANNMSIHTGEQDRLRVTCGAFTVEGDTEIIVTTPFSNCQITSLYGSASITALLVDGKDQFLPYDKAMRAAEGRSFVVLEKNKNRTGLGDWTFDAHGVKRSGYSFDNSAIQFDLDGQHDHIRISGWSKIPDDDGEALSMRILNEENTSIVSVYVWAKSLYVQDGSLKGPEGTRLAPVPSGEWWYWSIEAEHYTEVRTGSNASSFDQEWRWSVALDSEQYSGTTSVHSGIKLRRHFMSAAKHFKDMPNHDKHECFAACANHKDCHQWSWSDDDRHCYLHATRCHEDSECVHGRHLLHSMHSHRMSHFEITSRPPQSTNALPTRWRSLRAEPVIPSPECTLPDLKDIHSRWHTSFAESFIPFEPDATRVCNSIATTWVALPGYESKVCYGQPCTYKAHDFGLCGGHIEYISPPIPTGCDGEKYAKTNWTAFCRYMKSFDTEFGRVPFLGGLELDLGEICQSSWDIFDQAQMSCPKVNSGWFTQCFERTSVYEEHCSAECVNTIGDMLSTYNNSEGICKQRESFLDIYTNASGDSSYIPPGCNCGIGDLIITDFCLMQDAYHSGPHIQIPELYHSECSAQCHDTLRDTLNRSDWREWCYDMSAGSIPGICSKTVCECDAEENVGVAGSTCELTCPSGISNGKELACSGRNGQCFAVDPLEIEAESEKQLTSSETRIGSNFSGPLVPEWLTGPSPTMDGRCQCALGSGTSCSIPCDRCNNGTYGYEMTSQNGICDSFNGICRALPPFMRYNTRLDDISYNTTAFESERGVYKWKYPDRFLYESDETLMMQALRSAQDPEGNFENRARPDTDVRVRIHENIDTMLRVFEDLCWPGEGNMQYLHNDQGIEMEGVHMVNDTITLKKVDPPLWGQCTRIQVHEDWYFCFARGNLYAFDNDKNTPLVVRQSGETERPKQKMTFAKRNLNTMYAYGGEYSYPRTVEIFSKVYKITYERRTWHPYDIVFVDWSVVRTTGISPPGAVWAPMVSFFDQLFVLISELGKHTMYTLRYETPTRSAEWSVAQTTHMNASGVWMEALSNKGATVYFDNGYGMTFRNGWSSAFISNQSNRVDDLTIGYVAPAGVKMSCQLSKTNTSLQVSGIDIALFDNPPIDVRVFIEEWRTIDTNTKADIVQRVHKSILWTLGDDISLQELVLGTTQTQKQLALDSVSRIYMHQARWYMYTDTLMRYKMSDLLGESFVKLLEGSEPQNPFLDFLSSLPPSFFSDTPVSSPSKVSVRWEGDIFKRCLVFMGHFDATQENYVQNIDFEIGQVTLQWQWNETEFVLRISNEYGDMQWSSKDAVKTFVVVMHLEEWIYDTSNIFVPLFSAANKTSWQALIQVFVMPEVRPTSNMLSQTSTFVQYTPSHCSLTASEECPGLTPYTKLPCSGRGKCAITCQCTCDIAKSVLASSDNALANLHWSLSPYRGDGCETTCPGYDGYHLNSICSSNGLCQRDGTCTCNPGRTGDACQFECPVDENGHTCSLHGGCGTQAHTIDDYNFGQTTYMDILTSKNRQHFSSALGQFYSTCELGNYVEESAAFSSHVQTGNVTFTSWNAAAQTCSNINSLHVVHHDLKESRTYAPGRCAGIVRDGSGFKVALLRKVTTEYLSDQALEIFECVSQDCSLETQSDTDKTVSNLDVRMDAPFFHFEAIYVHGNSKGTDTYKINGMTVVVDMDWTLQHCEISINAVVIVNATGPLDRVSFDIQGQMVNRRLYKHADTFTSSNNTIWLAPRYDQKYRRTLRQISGKYFNVKSPDTGTDRPLALQNEAELECDAIPECLGIIRWPNLDQETLFSLYTNVPKVNSNTLFDLDGEYDYFEKMSLFYKGQQGKNNRCEPVLPGLANYPKVDFVEEYDIPIQNVDIQLAVDKDTGSVEVGHGIWTHCWTRKPHIQTKIECYEEAEKQHYGFAFSEDTKVCLIYTGITDPTKIKLDKYNSNARLSLDDPCQKNALWIT